MFSSSECEELDIDSSSSHKSLDPLFLSLSFLISACQTKQFLPVNPYAQEAQELEEECAEKAGECLGNLLAAVLGDNDEEVCSELREMTSCLQEIADKCLGEEKDDELDQDLREMNNLIAENCPAVAGKCFQQGSWNLP
ncbi:hypothetical protein TNCV_4721291 [Trichonephila clavipes]|uniref:Uncharacterized protein n=1 Tax=Trichonephila clavipes TaxID=2585209 RepID=A0A8X6W710_TRICX|nr:hypothetical protein TNCV_4721291 [Trichonephila clavipes]